MTIDDVLPHPHWRTRHERHVDAPAAAALAAARSVTLDDMPLATVLLAIRAARLRRPAPRPFVTLLERGVGMQPLGDGVWGAVLRPWRNASRNVDDFAAFGEPGWVKVAMSLTAAPDGGGALLATETRIAATSEDARRAFGRYWLVVRAGSGLVRRSWLHAAARAARRSRPGPTAARP